MNKAFAVLCLSFLCLSGAVEAAVTASVSRDQITLGDTLRLQLENDGDASGQPDLGPLRNDFDIIGRSSGSSMQFINGDFSSRSTLTLLLSAKRDGELRIPSLRWGDAASEPINITVTAAASANGSAPGANEPHVFVTSRIEPQQPYLQAAAVLSIRLYADLPLYEPQLEAPASSDVLIKQIGDAVQSREIRHGRSYQVIESKFQLTPLRSGPLRLDGPLYGGHIADNSGGDPFANDPAFSGIFGRLRLPGMMNATRPFRVRGEPIELNVLPRPAAADGAHWLPAQKLEMSANWRPQQLQAHAGEPLTLNLKLQAQGLSGAQLPAPVSLLQLPDGLKAYPDQAQDNDVINGAVLSGERQQNIALIAQQPGSYTLPAINLDWWDVNSQTKRQATLPARRIEILPTAASKHSAAPQALTNSAAAPASAPSPAAAAQDDHWRTISLILALLLTSALIAWPLTLHRARRRAANNAAVNSAVNATSTANSNTATSTATSTPATTASRSPGQTPGQAPQQAPRPSAAQALAKLQQACKENNAAAARNSLIAWAAAVWPHNPPIGLNALAKQVNDEQTSRLLRQLDRACSTGEAWRGDELAHFQPPASGSDDAGRKQEPLASLYPD